MDLNSARVVLKDSDYLSVLFHLYDSDDDDDEEEAERHKLALQRDERRRSCINSWDSFLVNSPFTLRMTHDDDLRLFLILL